MGGDANASDKNAFKKMVSERAYESSSKIDMVGTKSANNKIRIKITFKHDVMMMYYGRETKMKANITGGMKEISDETFGNETKEMTAQDKMTSRIGS